MPRGDGTGPMGMGRMTGQGAGYCAGFATPGYANLVGFGCGFGGGRGFRRIINCLHMPVILVNLTVYGDLILNIRGNFYESRVD